MKRFISLSLAALFGLATATHDPTFLASVDVTDYQKVSCYFYDDFTIFDLRPLGNKDGYTNKGYKINFCKPFDLSETKKAFAYH
jgi:hypothetical protein